MQDFVRAIVATAILLSSYAGVATAEEMPLFDAHIHYSHDAVKQVPPRQAAKILRDAGIRKALVSSSDDDGTQKLHEAAPDIVVPSLRPYRRRGETRTWVDDESVIAYLKDRSAATCPGSLLGSLAPAEPGRVAVT